jgi:threonine synthase
MGKRRSRRRKDHQCYSHTRDACVTVLCLARDCEQDVEVAVGLATTGNTATSLASYRGL